MASPFEITASNVKVEIESATVNERTGKVDIKFKAKDPRIANFQLTLAQYNTGSGYANMTLLPNEARTDIRIASLNEDLPAKGEYTSFMLVWDSSEDLSLIEYPTVNLKIQGQDSDATAQAEQIFSDTIELALRPVIDKHPLPLEFLKDTTPDLAFEVPGAMKPCNMHFTLVVADNEELNDPIITEDSSIDQTGWEFQDKAGDYKPFLLPGCPSIDALFGGARARYTVQVGDALSIDTYYYQFVVKTATKKIPMEEMVELPINYHYYPENLGFLLGTLPGGLWVTIDNLDQNPEDLINPEAYGPYP